MPELAWAYADTGSYYFDLPTLGQPDNGPCADIPTPTPKPHSSLLSASTITLNSMAEHSC